MPIFLQIKWFSIFVFGLICQQAIAQIQAVEQIDKGLFISAEPTITYLWPSSLGESAKATVIFIPGGDGSVGMKPNWRDGSPYLTQYHFNQTLRRLSDKSLSSGAFNVVIYDNPEKFTDLRFLSDRRASDHMIRIESVVRYYADNLKRPIWLMGHSNGGYSITEFQRYLQSNGKENLVYGLIYSSGRRESDFGKIENKPLLFLATENDGCKETPPSGVRNLFERVKATNKAATEFIDIKTAQPEPRNPCFSGIHMYFGAGPEVAAVLDDFLNRNTPAR